MTKKTARNTKTTAKKAKRVSLSKRTLKDLQAGDSNPKGGRAAFTLVHAGCCTLKDFLSC